MRLHLKFLLLSFCFSFLFAQDVTAQIGIVDREAEVKPKLVILGTYHMATTTSNVINAEVDDVLSPDRQKQIIELLEKLKRFNPTKIVVEVDIEDDTKANDAYKKYLSGEFELTRNEVHQLGFRLAKMLGHKRVYCVDWGIFPKDPIYNYMKYAAKDAELNAFLEGRIEKLRQRINDEVAKMRMLPVTEQLILINQPGRMETDHEGYFDIMRIGRGGEYSGADYLSWWYGRNMKILVNIIRITESSDERILVIYGAGHSKLLTQFAEESGFYELVSPLDYLQQ